MTTADHDQAPNTYYRLPRRMPEEQYDIIEDERNKKCKPQECHKKN